MSENTIRGMTPQECVALLGLLRRGASVPGACRSLGIDLASFDVTLAHSRTFRQLLRQVWAGLSDNVCAALYQKAMQGSVSAQLMWLKLSPPPHWREQGTGEAEEGEGESLSAEELEGLEELLREAKEGQDKFVERLLKEVEDAAGEEHD